MFKIIIEFLVLFFIIISFLMIIQYSINIRKTMKYIDESCQRMTKQSKLDKHVSMLILIPVLREQNIICDTINYFSQLHCENMSIHLCIAGTQREYQTLKQFGFEKSTKEIVENYCKKHTFSKDFSVTFFEADDVEYGDRATQLNYATNKFLSQKKADIIGVYDADSRPTLDTLIETASRYLLDNETSYQQPAFFLKTVNEMTQKKENPILIANALYQNTWSFISEIPMWIKYTKQNGNGKGNYYCIGHGEFFPTSIYQKFHFPEHEITDGIQIGYRLSMSGKKVSILYNYCNDDVPHNVKSLINQHRRWYGGCMRLMNSYNWCKNNKLQHKKSVVFSGLWSQFRWAFTANLYIFMLILSILLYALFFEKIFLISMIVLGVIYCYVFPIIATLLTPIKKEKISIGAFLLLPVAIYIKSIGPNIYFFNRIFKRENIYGKVER